MNVKLVAVTKPVIPECNDANELIAYCARVSSPANQDQHDTAGKLLRYLIKHKHWSPFEMAHMVLEIETTRDIGRQILRHGSFKFQEFSQRYAVVDVDSFELSEARLQDKRNRQNSLEVHDKALADWWTLNQARHVESAASLYNTALDKGIAKEVARKLLPEGLTGTRMYMTGSIRSWIHYCANVHGVRRERDTQKEHREIAEAAWEILSAEFPAVKEALDIVDGV